MSFFKHVLSDRKLLHASTRQFSWNDKSTKLIFHLCPKIIQVRHGPLNKKGCFILQTVDYHMKMVWICKSLLKKKKKKKEERVMADQLNKLNPANHFRLVSFSRGISVHHWLTAKLLIRWLLCFINLLSFPNFKHIFKSLMLLFKTLLLWIHW